MKEGGKVNQGKTAAREKKNAKRNECAGGRWIKHQEQCAREMNAVKGERKNQRRRGGGILAGRDQSRNYDFGALFCIH